MSECERECANVSEGVVEAGSDTARAIVHLLQAGRRFIFVYSDDWDFGGAERRGTHTLIDEALNANEAMAYRKPVP